MKKSNMLEVPNATKVAKVDYEQTPYHCPQCNFTSIMDLRKKLLRSEQTIIHIVIVAF